MPETDLLRKIESDSIEKLKRAYVNKSNVQTADVEICHDPFSHGIIHNLISDDSFVSQLVQELNSPKVKYAEKNNDLYKFRQTGDLSKLKKATSPGVCRFRDQILYGRFLELLRQLTHIDELSSSKIDVTSSKYSYTDYLLCHDDDIHDTNLHGRRIAYIYYLVDPDWSELDGGSLDLFSVDDQLRPIDIKKSIVPKRNSLLFFEVSDRSFHQVAEIMSKAKTRLSINGWFHGPVNTRQSQPPEPLPDLVTLKDADVNLFFDWVVERYIKPDNQADIQLNFSESSEIKLDGFFHTEKYKKVSEALESSDIVWSRKGPYNRRNYEVADLGTVPAVVTELITILTSEHMGLTLSNMTGLALHPSVPLSNEEEESDEESDQDSEEESGEEYQDGEESDGEGSNGEESNGEEDENAEESSEEEEVAPKKIKLTDGQKKGSEPCSSQSVINEEKESKVDEPSASEETSKREMSKCYLELRRWTRGHYTLIRDDDKLIKSRALDLMIHFKSGTDWNVDCGGSVSYLARDEDEELLTVNPEDNCVALVYRDEETLRFTKYVNAHFSERTENKSNRSYYELSIVYYE